MIEHEKYLKDIIERYNLKKVEALDELSILLSTMVGNLIIAKKLAIIYENQTKKIIINKVIDRFLDSNEFLIIGINDFLLNYIA